MRTHLRDLPRSFKSSRNPLEQLCRLDPSAPKFRVRARKIFFGEEYRQWVISAHGDDLVGLVDYLDKVCSRFSFTRSPLKPM